VEDVIFPVFEAVDFLACTFVCHPEQGTREGARHGMEETERELV
jgi:hypothetical protein